jgi:hypothetical protein
VIYTNGETEGFGEGAWIVNNYPSLVREAVSRQLPQQLGQPEMLSDAHTEQHRTAG